jgi:DNA mismatch endonuclease, patch repair protein
MADIYSSEKRSAIMSRVRSCGTRPERAVRAVLRKLSVSCRSAADDLPGKPDIVLRKRQVVIFVHGCYWHRHSCSKGRSVPRTNVEFWGTKLAANVRRDKKNYRLLRKQGWKVLIVWECETRNSDRLCMKLARECGK